MCSRLSRDIESNQIFPHVLENPHFVSFRNFQHVKVEEKSFDFLCAIKKTMANKTPKEIWVKIWSLVDFKTLQKSCTVVCKNWREGIRGNASLSDHMTLNNKQKSLEDINEVLSNWEALKIVRMSREMSNDELLQLAIAFRILGLARHSCCCCLFVNYVPVH